LAKLSRGYNKALEGMQDWLQPHFVDASGNMVLSIHTFAVRSEGQRIIVDTCLGSPEKHGYLAVQDEAASDFLAALTSHDFDPLAVDQVLCTHLHFDHVGWNTVLHDGAWVPTFPNARYLMGRGETDYWSGLDDDPSVKTYRRSVAPILDAGLAEMVEPDHQLTGEVSLFATPGHTPGHASVLIESEGERAVITGDVFHSPLQIGRPDWTNIADVDSDQAKATRRQFIDTCADSSIRVLGTHFASPTAGRIRRDDDGTWFEI
jgi:glyoxylase-like metal-dependent hydrolase (beta-lactamase superfamily II)